MGLFHLISVHPLQMTRFLDPLRTAWEQSNPWTLFNVAIYPLGQWSLPPGHDEIAHCTPWRVLVWITPWDSTSYVIRRSGMHKWNSMVKARLKQRQPTLSLEPSTPFLTWACLWEPAMASRSLAYAPSSCAVEFCHSSLLVPTCLQVGVNWNTMPQFNAHHSPGHGCSH